MRYRATMIAGGSNPHFGAPNLKDELRTLEKKLGLASGGASGLLQSQGQQGLKKTSTGNNNTKIGFVGATVVGLTSNSIPYQVPKVRTPTGPPVHQGPPQQTKLAGAAEKALLPKMKPRSLNTSFNKGYYHYHASSKEKSSHHQISQGSKFLATTTKEDFKVMSPSRLQSRSHKLS